MIGHFKYSFIIVNVFFLCLSTSAEAKIQIVRSLEDFQKNLNIECTRYVIHGEIDLKGTYILLPKNSRLNFYNGCLMNGTIEGNNTKLQSTKKNVFHNCIINGKWQSDCAYSLMFDLDLDAIVLLKNLSHISPNIKLSSNREYIIHSTGEIISLSTIEALGYKKPVLQFHTINPNISGLIFEGNDITIRNLIISDDYNPNNDYDDIPNDATIGNTIVIRSETGRVQNLLIDGCKFLGGTSSSYVASSQTINCFIKNCYFSGYIADHAVYCSMVSELFDVKNCVINEITHTRGIFKIRTSDNVRWFSLKDVDVCNLNGYLATIGLLKNPTAKIMFDNVHVNNKDNTSMFYGFCIYDETHSSCGIDNCNAEELIIKNCRFDCGYNGEPIIYSGSEKPVSIKNISYINTYAKNSSFGGGFADNLHVNHCIYENDCKKSIFGISAKDVTIDNTTITVISILQKDCLFFLNYSDVLTESILLHRVDLNLNVNNLFFVNKGDKLNVKMDRCRVSNLITNYLLSPEECKISFKIRNTLYSRNQIH